MKPEPKIEIYIPEHDSSAYRTLMILQQNTLAMSKEQLKLILDKTSSTQSIWNGLNLLIRKKYVEKVGNSSIYKLTDIGKEVAQFLKLENDIIESQQVQDVPEDVLLPFDPIRLEPGKYKIRLVIDNREIASIQDRKYIITALKNRGVDTIVRQLGLGDVLWIAQNDDAVELVLGYIIERKTISDLSCSITDGRYHEQEQRLTQSGLLVTYLIEDKSPTAEKPLNEKAIETATATFQVKDGFLVKHTRSVDETIEYISLMYNILKAKFENQTLLGIPHNVVDYNNFAQLKCEYPNHHFTYQSFCDVNNKSSNMSLQDVFADMLMTVPGISNVRATAISMVFSTIRNLYNTYQKLPDNVELRMIMVAKIVKRATGVNISKQASIEIYHILCLENY